ncbi:Twinfilin-1 [Coemansia spiralis]|uniref:Twinfilin-1 n=2 Tax=Coemansia TaxID=4863 RepID=A0A9W8KX35_9FUNG|nr:Twinfilin-1 [Coemansia umbellata]KAJ2624263.1 Twinfilin-1 [Coemansia sp. RSA 1358]KAJ2674198.1 Twinfilin-1 [Coemansia spiralis]
MSSSSLTSGIVATPKLQQFLDESQGGQHKDVSLLRVQVRGDDLVETARKNGSANGDLLQLEEYLGDSPAFFLLRATPSTWYVITWMPEGKVGTLLSMVYASTQSSLKKAVGNANVEDSLHFGTVEEALGKEQAASGLVSTGTFSDVSATSATSAAVKATPPEPAPKPSGLGPKKPSPLSPSTSYTEKQDKEQGSSYTAQSTHAVTSSYVATTTVTTRTITTSSNSDDAGSASVAARPQAAQDQPSGQRGVFVKKMDPRLAMSKSELEHIDILNKEDSARMEQLEQMHMRLRSHAPPAKPAGNPDNHHANSRGQKQTVAAASGGFHTVTLPLSLQAKDALNEFVSNVGITVVELQLEANKCVTSPQSFTSTDEFSPNPSEPRFYVMRTPGSRAFVYSCPESSPPRLRMVYSTTGAPTLSQIQDLGCKITHRLSLFSPKECTLIAVAATIRNGQAQRVDSEKPVDDVVNYIPSAPARSLPSRFAANSTRALDAFTDEDGFRKAFSGVRPDAPAPAPFRAQKPERSSLVHAHKTNDDNGVDSSPNSGAATWGVQLKSSQRTGVAPRSAASSNTSIASNASAVSAKPALSPTTKPTVPSKSAISVFSAKSHESRTSAESVKESFSQAKLAGEAGDNTPTSSSSSVKSLQQSQQSEETTTHSSVPGLRKAFAARKDEVTDEGKWDPWRSVSASGSTSVTKKELPKSTLQSTVFTKDKEGAPESIIAYMSDITYPPLQGTASDDK